MQIRLARNSEIHLPLALMSRDKRHALSHLAMFNFLKKYQTNFYSGHTIL